MRIISAIALFALTSCNPWKEVDDEFPSPLSAAFFAPKVGETLTFRVVKDSISPDQNPPLSASDVQRTGHIQKVTYDGTMEIDGLHLHRQKITISGKETGGQLLHWNGETLALQGTFDLEQKTDLLKVPLPIATTTMIAGDFWPWPEESGSDSGFRVLGEEKIKTLAGTVKAQKITQISREGDSVTIKDYWFTKKIGVVRETTEVYRDGLLRERVTTELMSHEIPK